MDFTTIRKLNVLMDQSAEWVNLQNMLEWVTYQFCSQTTFPLTRDLAAYNVVHKPLISIVLYVRHSSLIKLQCFSYSVIKNKETIEL